MLLSFVIVVCCCHCLLTIGVVGVACLFLWLFVIVSCWLVVVGCRAWSCVWLLIFVGVVGCRAL